MTGVNLREGRKQAGWTQSRLAARLGVTQVYLSLMENRKRRVPDLVARRVAGLLRLPATALPFSGGARFGRASIDRAVEEGLAKLGYPGLAYRRKRGEATN